MGTWFSLSLLIWGQSSAWTFSCCCFAASFRKGGETTVRWLAFLLGLTFAPLGLPTSKGPGREPSLHCASCHKCSVFPFAHANSPQVFPLLLNWAGRFRGSSRVIMKPLLCPLFMVVLQLSLANIDHIF